ncbi:hypothetical protein [Roseateles sp.]|uniref:hypothetical protein n=1 Tax=Roseateles sp. TaxID=1971397 RepID=UPI002DFCC45F|nr:hypothetical protein [Roseateles sp.]
MDYDRVRDQLLAGAMDSNDQPQLLGLRPSDLSTAWALSLPSRPTSLTVATDGSRAYVGLVNGQIVQVDLATQAIASSFDISEGKGTTYFPLSLAIRPGAVDTVAVSTGYVDAAGLVKFHRLGVWQGGVPWPQTLEVGPSLNNPAGAIRFSDASTLITLNTESSDNIMLKVLVGDRTLSALFPGLDGRGFSQSLDMLGTEILLPAGLRVDPVQFKTTRWVDGIGGSFLALPGLAELCEVQLRKTNANGGFELRLVTTGIARQEQVRRLRYDLPTLQPTDGRRPDLVNLQALAGGRVAVHLYERVTGRTHLLVLDVESTAPLTAQTALATQGSSQGMQLTALSHAMNGLAYDPEGNRLVASVAASAGPNGCALIVIDPTSGNIEARYLLSSPPGQVFVSSTGRIAYVSLPQERALQQVRLGSSPGLGWKVEGLPDSVLDVAISPTDQETIAFTTASQAALYLYTAGTRVTAIGERYPDIRYVSSVVFTGANSLAVADSYTTDHDLQHYSINNGTITETGREALPMAFSFSFGRYLTGLIYTYRVWASLDTAQAGGWILPPEGIPNLQQLGYVSVPAYDGVALSSKLSGGAVLAGQAGGMSFDRLAPRAISPLGGDLVGVRRLYVQDNGLTVPLNTAFKTVIAGTNRWASLCTPPEATDATLYIVTDN